MASEDSVLPLIGKVFLQMPKIMREVAPIAKSRTNTQGSGYKFRGIDDVYFALHDILARHDVWTVPTVLEERSEERLSKSGGNLIYRILKIKYTFYSDDMSAFDSIVVGEGMDSGDKASNKAMSVAHKYALLQVFCIPTEEAKDPENESHEVRPHEVYTGTDAQKELLYNMCLARKLTQDSMQKLHARLITAKVPMHLLKTDLEKYLPK